jgi:hypothetical protein
MIEARSEARRRNEPRCLGSARASLDLDRLHPGGDRQLRVRGLGQGEPAVDHLFAAAATVPAAVHRLYLFVLHYAGKRRSAALGAAG